MSVIFETSLGDLTIDLFCAEAPKSTLNFLKLCKIKYYDHCFFYDIQKDFTIQCGDPTNTGKGGSSIWGYVLVFVHFAASMHMKSPSLEHFLTLCLIYHLNSILKGDSYRYMNDEIHPKLKHEKRGVVAMATTGKDKIGSQFYITTSTHLTRLDGKYTIIGEVVEGFETLEKLNEAVVDVSGHPIQVLRIQHTIVLDDPFEDPEGLIKHVPDRSPSPPHQGWPIGLLPEPDDLNAMMDQETEESRREHLAATAAKAKAEALMLLGELPDADVRPPDNILFVCKLNPTTPGKSLGVIFSRFGKVLSSDVIFDRKGQSLCYAFVEFDNRSSCEEAYLKMQNVLIDGRRIHVDFCQSVAKANGFRAAGGWKKFFANRASDMNDSHSDQRSSSGPFSGGLQFKKGAGAPLSFAREGSNSGREYGDQRDQRDQKDQRDRREWRDQRDNNGDRRDRPRHDSGERRGERGDSYRDSRDDRDYRRDDRRPYGDDRRDGERRYDANRDYGRGDSRERRDGDFDSRRDYGRHRDYYDEGSRSDSRESHYSEHSQRKRKPSPSRRDDFDDQNKRPKYREDSSSSYDSRR